MRARSYAVVRPGGVLGIAHSEPPLTLRRVTGDPDCCALCLIGSAAGPLEGDDLALSLHIEAHAAATITSTGAHIAQGGHSAIRFSARLDEGADLCADPGPLIVCTASQVKAAVALDLAADARVYWRETIVLGRITDIEPGWATVRWDVSRDGRPVLRQLVDTSSLAPHRILAGAFVSAPDLEARTIVAGPHAVAQLVDLHAVLVTVVGKDNADVQRQLASLIELVGSRHR